tara:strand:+ start:9823 stop:10191 length:369 start_codon:yes stop_codon:yes gene_type:complete
MTKTIFCDIDGTLLYQNPNFLDWYDKPIESRFLLDGVKEKLFDWYVKGYTIILTTGRPETDKKTLEQFFGDNGLYYHQLVMNCGSGERYLINDNEPVNEARAKVKAFAIPVIRNSGIGDLEL